MTASGIDEAFEIVKDGPLRLVLSDIDMPGGDSIELLKRIKEHDPRLDVIMVTGAVDADTAVEALETVVSASPDDAEGHYLLGRARRMAADGEGARASLERAVELTPEHYDAKLSLGGLLLDLGDFEAAEALYRPLSRLSRTSVGARIPIQGRLGLVEALIGLDRLDDAQVQLRLGERRRAQP